MIRSASMLAALAGLAATAAAQTDIYWNTGSGNWNLALNWNPQNVPNAVDENALIQGPPGAMITQDISLSINALEIGQGVELVMPANRTLSLFAGAHNDGLITLNPTGSSWNAVLNIAADGSLSGLGVVRLMAGSNDSEIMAAPGVTLTNLSGHTIEGAGYLTAMMVNEGLVLATDTGLDDTLSVRGYDKTNNASMEAGDGATLEITDTTLTQSAAGVLKARDGGTVRLAGSQVLVGGRMTADPGGTLLRPGTGNTTLDGTVIEADLLVEPNSNVYCIADAMDFPGRIVLHPSTSNYNSFLSFNTDCTASGGGSVYLAGQYNDCSIQTTNDAVLTVGPDFLIEGAGTINASLVNNGEIKALPTLYTTGPMVITGSAKTNNAMMGTGVEGTLEIASVAVTQGAAGVIRADTGTVEFTGSPSVTGGTIDSINGGSLVREGSGTLTLNDVTIDGDLEVQPNGTIASGGATLTNNATVFINNTTSSYDGVLIFNADCAVGGTGEFFLGGNAADSQINTLTGVTVTHGAMHTIAGSGHVNAAIINDGTFRADPGDVGDGRLYVRANDKVNNADMIGGPGGQLMISGITLTQGPGGVLLADGGEIEFDATSQTVVGGRLDSINGGRLVKEGGGTVTLTGVTIDADLEVLANGHASTAGPTLVNNATVFINNSTSSYDSTFTFGESCTVSGAGAFYLGGGGGDSRVQTGSGAVATLGADTTIEGSGYVNANLVNNGIIRAVPTDHGGSRLTLRVESKVNNNRFSAEAGGVLEIYGITLDQTGPGVVLADGGQVELGGVLYVNGGRFDSATGGTITSISGANVTLDGVTNDGDLHVGPNSQVNVLGDTLVNNGLIRVNDTTSSFNGVLRFNLDAVVIGSGVIRMGGVGQDSQILAPASGQSLTIDLEQTIEGVGYLEGSFINDGTIRPGLPTGEINGPATIALGPAGTLDIQAEGNPGAHGRLDMTGAVTLDGNLRFRFLNDFVPTVFPAVYEVAHANAIYNEFWTLDLPDPIQPNSAVYIGYDATTVYVAFTCLPDNSPPFGLLDLSDVTGFVTAFIGQEPPADLAEPFGLFDLADVLMFVTTFTGGCP